MDEAGRSVVVQPGIVHLNLDEFVKTKGLYYPPDPASGRACTIGGNLGENAGRAALLQVRRDDQLRHWVCEVVLADGRMLRTGGRAFDYPEYDLTGLLVGSEGTLGIITEAQLRLMRNVPGIKTLMAIFDSVEIAGEAVSAVISRGLVPATLEMMDKTMIGIVENYVHAGLPVDAEALLIIEADGHPASLEPQMAEIVEVLKAQGARELRLAQNAGRAREDLVRAEERVRRHRADQPRVSHRGRHGAALEARQGAVRRSTVSAPRTICASATSSTRATATCTR